MILAHKLYTGAPIELPLSFMDPLYRVPHRYRTYLGIRETAQYLPCLPASDRFEPRRQSERRGVQSRQYICTPVLYRNGMSLYTLRFERCSETEYSSQYYY